MKNLRGVSRMGRMAWAGLLLMLTAGTVAAQEKYERTVVKYTVPDVTLVDQRGERVGLLEVVNSGKPVLVDFVYATCTTICPVLSAGFASFQKRLGDQVESVQLISFTIDPEHDTPEMLSDYLKRYRARPGWDFYTGTREDIDRVMYAFNAYVENKMSHYPVTFLKAPGNDEWVRIYGLLGSKDLVAEYELIMGKGE